MKMDSATESASHYQTQSEALSWMSGPGADLAAKLLSAAETMQNAAILDVGAGSAVWGLAMARAATTPVGNEPSRKAPTRKRLCMGYQMTFTP